MVYDVIIIGAGPAGLAAGIYGKRAGLDILILDTSSISGGQILNTYEIDNYPGFPGASGQQVADAMRQHCDKLGVEFARGKVTSIIDNGSTKELVTKKQSYSAKAVIIATGASNKQLGCPGEDELSGMGVSYCATCDGAFFKEKQVAVVGGGDVALEDAIYLSRFCTKVYLIHRRDEFRGAKILQDQVKESISIRNIKTDVAAQLAVDGIFIAVGTTPNTAFLSDLLETDANGYILADETCKASVAGFFAAGDVRTKPLRQVLTATADGANAITSIQKYLQG